MRVIGSDIFGKLCSRISWVAGYEHMPYHWYY